MKKKTMSYVMTGALSITIFSGVHSSPAHAASPQLIKEQTASSVTRTGTKNFSDVIAKQAAALGINIDGDDLETAAKKVRVTKLHNQARSLNIETKDKDEKLLRHEVKHAHEINVYDTANFFGIETAGKRIKDIIDEISHISPEAASQLNGFY
ncbi:hypothetical protein [Domibacillus epiphyticus]|uniref:DUF4142 domain-containing protein n=1 Tax=Domibacillus epiphyticus TaxID=1714355 RepID=A0A1V2AB35_9BACI|nr:hypothetical protein [Domibacillus epiphyticus]OMP68208.1 hypothetical protein BTO28_02790 [Domibacillus epiphyticus]